MGDPYRESKIVIEREPWRIPDWLGAILIIAGVLGTLYGALWVSQATCTKSRLEVAWAECNEKQIQIDDLKAQLDALQPYRGPKPPKAAPWPVEATE